MALYLQVRRALDNFAWRETRRGKGAKTATRSEHSAEGDGQIEGQMITSNDLFYAAKGPGEWPSNPKYIAQLSSAPKARKGSTYT